MSGIPPRSTTQEGAVKPQCDGVAQRKARLENLGARYLASQTTHDCKWAHAHQEAIAGPSKSTGTATARRGSRSSLSPCQGPSVCPCRGTSNPTTYESGKTHLSVPSVLPNVQQIQVMKTGSSTDVTDITTEATVNAGTQLCGATSSGNLGLPDPVNHKQQREVIISHTTAAICMGMSKLRPCKSQPLSTQPRKCVVWPIMIRTSPNINQSSSSLPVDVGKV